MTVATPGALAAAFSGALNDGDADALAARFTKHALFVNIAGMRTPGRMASSTGTGLVFTLVRADGGWDGSRPRLPTPR